MNKKIIIIAGQTGAGKTKLANEVARNINGEIILVDSIQFYKHLNIIANKPSKFLTEVVKYHNLSEYELSDGTVNAMIQADKIRKTISDIWSRGKTPILEGGCGFYYKTILTGSASRISEMEEDSYNKYILIAKEIIRHDNCFDTTFARLRRMDTSIPETLPIKNDFYRLEKRLADAMMYGDGAYKTKKIDQVKIKDSFSKTFFSDATIYKFFLYCNRLTLNKMLEDRTEKMIENGLLKEVSDLLSKDIIQPKTFEGNNIFTNAYGLIETIDYLNKFIYLEKDKDNIIKSYDMNISKKDEIANKYKKMVFKNIYDLMADISVRNRQYAKRQATWFKKQDKYLWINAEKDNLSNYLIKNYVELDQKSLDSCIDSELNLKTMENYSFSNIKTSNSNKYNLLKNNNKIKNIVIDSFKHAELNKHKLLEINKYLERKKYDVEEEHDLLNNEILSEHLEKYLKI